MSIPAVSGAHAILPPGRHSTTLAEIRDYFVTAAPFSEDREVVFRALDVWLTMMNKLVPNARYWINGGFVTHKSWAAPKDVDVVVLVTEASLNSLDSDQQEQFASLMTEDDGTLRRQPMGGLVDGFYTVRGSASSGDPAYWNNQWSRVKGQDGAPVVDLYKGFLEVIQ